MDESLDVHTLAQALNNLPPRCRQVVWMRRVENHSQKEVAKRLGIGEAMVEKHIAKAMRRLLKFNAANPHPTV